MNFIIFQYATFHVVRCCICQCQKRPFTNQYATFYKMKAYMTKARLLISEFHLAFD